MSQALNGVNIVVTRPAHQAEPLCKLIEQSGGTAIRFPVLEIVAPADPQALSSIIARINEFDLAIFISPNAVERSIKQIANLGGIPDTLQVAAVGQATANALTVHGHPPDIVPTQAFNSEALLAMDELQGIAGKRVIIFRGEGGRELLAEALTKRGAHVEYAECYRRKKPSADIKPFLAQWQRDKIDIIIVTSNQGLQNLYDMVGESGRSMLLNMQLLLVSNRTANLATQLGFTQSPIIATKASDEALHQSLIDWRADIN